MSIFLSFFCSNFSVSQKNQPLATHYCGLPVSSPLWVASQAPVSKASPEDMVNLYATYVSLGAGLVKSPFICDIPTRPSKAEPNLRIKPIRDSFGDMGFYLLGTVKDNIHYADKGTEFISLWKKTQETPLIANITVQSTDYTNTNAWAQLARKMVDAGADGLELNLSCPNFRNGVQVPCHDTDITVEIVRDVKEKLADTPVAIKISPDLPPTQLQEFVKKVAEAGVDGITASNSVLSLCPPDIDNPTSSPYEFSNKHNFCGTYGPWDRFFTYRNTALISQSLPKDSDITLTAVGGIVEPKNVVELMLLGAHSVELSSIVLWKGYMIIPEFLNYLSSYLSKQNLFLNQLVGKGFFALSEDSQTFFTPAVSKINRKNCTKCKLCMETICTASGLENNQVIVNENKCTGCGLCKLVCNYNARYLSKRKV